MNDNYKNRHSVMRTNCTSKPVYIHRWFIISSLEYWVWVMLARVMPLIYQRLLILLLFLLNGLKTLQPLSGLIGTHLIYPTVWELLSWRDWQLRLMKRSQREERRAEVETKVGKTEKKRERERESQSGVRYMYEGSGDREKENKNKGKRKIIKCQYFLWQSDYLFLSAVCYW